MLNMADIRGRDGVLPDGRPKGPVAYDSIVVNSNGIGAITFAARMARDPAFHGSVTVAAKPVAESRRLIDGCTLRARSVDYYAAALGTTRKAVLAAIYGPDWRQAETDHQRAALGTPFKGGVALGPCGVFMTSDKVKADRTAHQPLAYGVRNSRLMAALNDLAGAAGVQFANEPASSYDELRALAKGSKPLIVNGTAKPIEGARAAMAAASPRDFVAGAQMSFTSPRLKEAGNIGPNDSFVGMVNRDGALDLCVFYPLLDPLSPKARFYGIFYRAIRSASEADKAREQQILREQLEGVAYSLGLAPDDPDETFAAAFVPVSPWRYIASRQEGVLDLSRISGGGCPIIAGDGMARAGLGGFAAAEAILAGEAPEPAMNKALTRWRQVNYVQFLAMTRMPNISAFTMKTLPALAFSGFNLQRDWDMWAGAY
ncbi:MAG TPA: hypothetical protein VGN05_13220 [Parvibaculum sp.]|jgi:hypothetical protein